MNKGLIPMALLGFWMTANAYTAPPPGWFITGSAPNNYDMGTQPGDRHAGDNNAYIRAVQDGKGFGTLMQTISADAYRNQRVRLSGYLKTRAAGSAAMWMRIDGVDRRIAGFDNMEDRALRGNTEWQSYSVVLDVPSDALDIAFGVMLDGKGEVLADDFKLEIVGPDVPVTGKPRPGLPKQPANMIFSP
jgi:hypothetical protein